MPFASTTTNGKAITLSLTDDKGGVRVFVGKGLLMPRVTLTPDHIASAAKLLGIAALAPSADGASAAKWIEAVKTAEDATLARTRERDAQRVRAERAESTLMNRTQERDQARADHAAADVALQDTLEKLAKAEQKRDYNSDVIGQRNAMLSRLQADLDTERAFSAQTITERDAALFDAKQWQKLAASRADSLDAAKRDLSTLQENFDALSDSHRDLSQARKLDALTHAAELHRARALGWLHAGISLAVGITAFVGAIKLGWLGHIAPSDSLGGGR